MGDFNDRQLLDSLEGKQRCECCGTERSADDCDVVDGEVTCLDCVYTYYPKVWERRTGERPDE